ncbi:protein mab-21-like 4 [Protopterus annectens]|uniref:protein mab-21-like 4 n=1 Tax=Protopterus annectens TaxID=7888 RepID=UPI001CF9C4C8|nr:protein mab-21-like 4 [Protopterus annectens]
MASDQHVWKRYLRGIKIRQDSRIEDFLHAENIIFTILERVNSVDYRFLVDYSRDHANFEYSLQTELHELSMEVPLWLDSAALVLEADCKTPRYELDGVSHKQTPRQDFCYIGVPKEGSNLEQWSSGGIFHETTSSSCRGHIVPGKLVKLLKELIVAAIVYCRQTEQIKPGDVNATLLSKDSAQIPLQVRCGSKMIQFNITPKITRVKTNLAIDLNHRGKNLPKGALQDVLSEGADLIAASYYHWRHCFSRPLWKLLKNFDSVKGYHLDALCLLDRVNTVHWREDGQKLGLTFQHLQTILLWAASFFLSPEDWQELSSAVYRLLVVLIRCLAMSKLPSFLYPHINLFQDENIDLKPLYWKVLEFANCPEQFLHLHVTHMVKTTKQRMDTYAQTVLETPDQTGELWSTAYFDVLLSKFQEYHIQDAARTATMKETWLKIGGMDEDKK